MAAVAGEGSAVGFGLAEGAAEGQRQLWMCMEEPPEAPAEADGVPPEAPAEAEAQQALISAQLLQQLEERLAQRFGDAIEALAAGIERAEAKVDAIAPLVQSLSIGHIDTQREVQRLDTAFLEAQYGDDHTFTSFGDCMATMDASVKALQRKVDGGLAPFMQSFAIAQMELKARLDSSEATDVHGRVENLSLAREEAQAKLGSLEQRVRELGAEVAAASQNAATTAVPRKEAATQATAPSSIPACLLDTGVALAHFPAQQDVCDSPQGDGSQQGFISGVPSKRSMFLKHVRPGLEARSPEKEVSSPEKEGRKSAAKRAHRAEKLHSTEWSDALAVPFAQAAKSTIGLRTLERSLTGSRSLPYLPPVF